METLTVREQALNLDSSLFGTFGGDNGMVGFWSGGVTSLSWESYELEGM